ncbi:nucleoside/nucleotide kinase family protein [Velocimicrobium porci]|uniref:Guanylate kinase n=1 Tax=Velocimicrobium porci TaxID=2606634 RepID=A0A6L5Y1T0_9FIRM|nr:guanylate kinase [Velocimicrobium porci]MSS64807.1 guanylate kinase [Velocimicrobium porci]
MSKLFIVMGKSASGKDTIYKRILECNLGLKTVVTYTTRPIREGEQEGREYFFRTKEQLDLLEQSGKVIESSCYYTIDGPWYYFTADDGQINLATGDYLMITTVERYQKMRSYYGEEHVFPIYIEVEDGLRLERALQREREQKQPNYEELCRRFLADCKDFSEENLKAAMIEKRYQNIQMDICLKEIIDDIQRERSML